MNRSLKRQQTLKKRKQQKLAKKSLATSVKAGLGGAIEQVQAAPSANYLETIQMLDSVVRDCSQVSRRFGGIPSPTAKHYYASVIFTAMCTRSVSLAILAPCSPWSDKVIEHWDYGSLTGIARTLLELRFAFSYLCSEEIPEAEWQCRWNVFNLHDCSSRIRMFHAFDVLADTPDCTDELSGLHAQADELRSRLISNSYFLALSEKQQKKFLKGESAYLLPLEEIAVTAGFGKEQYRFFNVLLSSHIHALPMSFYRIGEERGRGLPTQVEENYSSMCLSLACTVLTGTRDEMIEMFDPLLAVNKSKRAPEAP